MSLVDAAEPRIIRLHAADQVVVAVDPIADGGPVGDTGVRARGRIMRGHKVAVRPIAKGEPILKYGQVIAVASRDIAPGEHVHEHNAQMSDLAHDYAFATEAKPQAPVPEAERATFQGYRRPGGRVGTRNYVAVISTVNCSATVSRYVAERFNRQGGLDGFDNVDGVVALTHGGGCAMNTKGEGFKLLQRTIWGYANNPNFGGVVLIGLGCETNQIAYLKDRYGIVESPNFRTLTIQETGGTQATIARACDFISEMLPEVNAHRRETVPASELVVALQCGGSDGYSGISANPALGHASDLLVAQGATTILSETPEIYGAEHLLTRRAVSEEVGRKLIERIEWWRQYAEKNDAEMNNNPSPGNKLGGLTTILEKSLGAAVKGGTANLSAVYEFAEQVTAKGLVFVDTPGYDAVCSTGQIASGATVMCFTTGRGSVSGFKPVPTLKLATNTPMYEKMRDDMDVNCGTIVTGEETVEEVGRRIFDKILATASGSRTFSEQYGYGDNEFVPWQIGAIM